MKDSGSLIFNLKITKKERFRVIIKDAIKEKTIKSYKLFSKSDNKENRAKRKQAAKDEAAEAEEHAKVSPTF